MANVFLSDLHQLDELHHQLVDAVGHHVCDEPGCVQRLEKVVDQAQQFQLPSQETRVTGRGLQQPHGHRTVGHF